MTVGGWQTTIPRMKLSGLSHDELLTLCAWCHCVIPEDLECFGFGTRVRPTSKHLIADKQGKVLPLPLSSGREIITVVTMSNSAASRDGYDICFQTCSEACDEAAKNAVQIDFEPASS